MDIKLKLSQYASQHPNQETCALVYRDNWGVEDFYLCSNKSPVKKHYFSIDPKDYKLANELGKICAVFHSHVNDNADFSPFDYQQSTGHNLIYWLYDLRTKSFKELNPNNHRYSKYLKKVFIEGSQDCFSLVRDFYQQELKIDIPNYFADRKRNFPKLLKELVDNKTYLELANKINFKTVKLDQIKTFDILFFAFYNRFHMGIYLGDGYLLHQPRVTKSCIEPLGDEFKMSFVTAIRKDLECQI